MYRNTTILIALLVTCGFTRDTIAKDAERAKTLARQAVVAGMLGDPDRRAKLLASALESDPNNARANWALGRVSVNNDWITLPDYEQQMQENRLLAAYDGLRNDLKGGKLTAMQLADWCREKHLFGREKLHLTEIWQSQSATPDQKLAASRRLGMQYIGGVWMTSGEARNLRQSIRTAQRNAVEWRPATDKLVRILDSPDPKRRKVAIERYQLGLDSTAILSIENLLSTKSEPFALLAVKFISEMPEYEATQSLVRHAVYPESNEVRQAATRQLATRAKQDSVPLLLSQLSNPLNGEFGISVGPDGMVRRTQQVMEQGRDANIRHINSTARGIHNVNQIQFNLNRQGVVRGITNTDDMIVARHLAVKNYDTVEDRLAAEAALRRRFALQRQQLIRQEVLRAVGLNRALLFRNQRSGVANERTMTALKAITNQDIESATPSAWWDWWNEENDRYQGEKPTYTRYASMSDPMQINYARTCECFPAGTLVRTQTGLREIESIEAGDQVLSKHTETGELNYKLVLATTVRPPSGMVTIGFEDGKIESTSGHLFWVEERGWKMAKNLKPNDLLHGLVQSRRVESVKSRADAEAHNLVVAEFGTYFVGKQGVLAHDNSERRRSNSITPGVVRVTR